MTADWDPLYEQMTRQNRRCFSDFIQLSSRYASPLFDGNSRSQHFWYHWLSLAMMWNRPAVSELTFFGGASPGQFESLHMRLQDSTLEEVLAIGRTSPRISGSTAALAAAQLGTAMAKMGLLVSCNHGFDNEFAAERLDSMIATIKQATEGIARRRLHLSMLIVDWQTNKSLKKRVWVPPANRWPLLIS
jgi:hypothetical protein